MDEARKRNGAVVIKKFMMLTVAVSMICNALADTETVGGYTWTYRINGDTATIEFTYYRPAISPTPNGGIAIPATLGGKPVTSIGFEVFSGCSGLTSVTIPDSVTSIGNSAFSGCSGLTSVTIPDSVTSIGDWAFYGCSSILLFEVGEGNEHYKSIDGLLLTKDGTTLVAGINRDVAIPGSVTDISSYAFCNCNGLTSVTIPDSVTSIGSYAFYGCSGLTSVTIPGSVTSIGYGAFGGYTSVVAFEVAEDNEHYKSVDGLLLTKDGKTLVAAVKGDVVIPDGVTSLRSYMFDNFSGLTSVTIPDSVTSKL